MEATDVDEAYRLIKQPPFRRNSEKIDTVPPSCVPSTK